MSTAITLRALAEAARRSRLLDLAMAKRLTAAAEAAGVEDTGSLARFLAGPRGPGGQLAGRLGALLAPPGLTFAEWRPHARLMDGLAGQAWLASKPGGEMALLRILPGGGQAEGGLQHDHTRFMRQVAVCRQLDHPHLVRFLGNGETPDGDLWLAVEYIESGDLDDLLRLHGGRLPETQVLGLGAQIAGALTELARLSLVHRAVSPSAILVAADGNAKLGNLFLARSTATAEAFTMVNANAGAGERGAWMTPEEVNGDPGWDIRGDVYSLGCVLFACLAGRPPFVGESLEVMHGHADLPPPDLRALCPGIDAAAVAAVASCLAKQPGQRPMPDALRETLQAVRNRLAGRSDSARQQSGPHHRVGASSRTPQPGGTRRRQISLAGEFADVPMNEVLQTLSRVKASGVLHLAEPDGAAQGLVIADGAVIALLPDAAGLGELAERLADVPGLDMARVRAALAGQEPPAARLAAFIASGQVAQEALDGVMTDQLCDAITRRFLDTAGSFSFSGDDEAGADRDAVAAARLHPLTINGNHLLMEAARQLDTWTALHRTLPGSWSIPRLDPHKAASVRAGHPAWPERAVLASIDGATPLGSVLALARATPYAAVRLIAELHDASELEFLAPDELLLHAEALAAELRAGAAEPLARAALAGKPGDARAARLFAGLLAVVEPDAVEDTLFAGVTPAPASARPTTSALMPMQHAAPPLEGRLEDAFAGDWLALLSFADGSGSAVHCFPAGEVQLGKLAKPPVQISLRNYPEAAHLAECQQISRSHCSLVLAGAAACVRDLGAANGTWLDGQRLALNAEAALTAERDHLLVVANVVRLSLRLVPGADLPDLPSPAVAAPGQPGALAIARIANRPELGYALVAHRLAIGGAGAGLVIAGLPPGPQLLVARCSGRWLWAPAQVFRAWRPVVIGETLHAGPLALTATAGDHRFYH